MSQSLEELLEIQPLAAAQANGQGVETEAGASGASAAEILDPEVARLHELWTRKEVYNRLRWSGLGGVFWGVVNIAVGFGGVEENSLNALLGLIGLFLLAEGIWLLVSPTVGGLLVDGGAILSIGIWNILVTMYNKSIDPRNTLGIFLGVGVLQIVWGIANFIRYRKLSKARLSPLTAEDSSVINDAIEEIKQASSKTSSDVVEFESGIPGARRSWKGRLFPNSVLLWHEAHNNLFIQPKKNFQLDKVKVNPEKGVVSAKIKLKQIRIFGNFSLSNYERVQAWLDEIGPTRSIGAETSHSSQPSLPASKSVATRPKTSADTVAKKSLRFRCPHCQTVYQVEIKHAGKSTKCTKCSSKLRIPQIKPE